ncbi:MAG: hypothetical protein JXR25_01530 [Pontiellaceae bacterium]|nr:hypothetical protein [Pontiellaceae bacterium]MBN2783480.1 hypothetical protein [Pontiellaceae bacterium]
MMRCSGIREARPVWPQGLESERNIHVGFRAVFDIRGDAPVLLRMAGSTIYRVFLNGAMIHHGPARGPHGFYRMDALNLSSAVKPGANLLAIEVVGYNCNSFAYLNQTSFLQAELEVNEQVVAATGRAGFSSLLLPERIQRVERYSFQRPFMEAYRLTPESDVWRWSINASYDATECSEQPDKVLLPRGVALPALEKRTAKATPRSGLVEFNQPAADAAAYWWMTEQRREELKSFRPEAFELDALQLSRACPMKPEAPGRILDLGINLTGFIRLQVFCARPVKLVVFFDEVLVEDDIDPARNTTLNLIYYELQPGTYALESMEPYTFRYLKPVVLEGNPVIAQAGIREYAHAGTVQAEFSCADPELMKLFEAGRQTFRQNALDIYMDCPGRERAGWLCDSFFTGRVEPLLCGDSRIEHNFLENYLLPERFAGIPEGMLPMCYPAEHPDGVFIPQWAMWFVLELEEYLKRTGDRSLLDRAGRKLVRLHDYFATFENNDGLLENLPGWNFIEWSKANELTDGISYPTNMLYARMLEAMGRLLDDDTLLNKARGIHAVVRRQAFDGTFFADHAVCDDNGIPQRTGESTEVCQYYAFFCGTATPETYPDLWQTLLTEFGPARNPTAVHERLHPANAFIGYFLRMELLSRQGETARLMQEMKDYFLGMAERTGTLWEHCDVRASCNHGFASHLCVHLFRDVLGVHCIDRANKTVEVSVPAHGPESCGGTIPLPDGLLRIRWSRGGAPQIFLPDGWQLKQTI